MKQILLDGIIGLLVVVLPVAVIGLVDLLIRRILDIRRSLEHLNLEISRTDGEERRYWRRKKKRLLLSLIPFSKWFRRRS